MKRKSIAFFGTPILARACLERLSESFDVKLVITRPDSARGRGQKIGISAVKDYAIAHGIDVYQPYKMGGELLELIRERNIDLNVVVAFGKIIPSDIIDLPPLGSVNLHASMLPKYRGPSPIEAAILNGEKKTGITLQRMAHRMDSGDILIQREVEIAYEDTSYDLLQKIIDVSPEFLVEGVEMFVSGVFKSTKQREEDATYCSIISKADGMINWSEKAGQINNKIRAYNIWPVAYTYLDNKLLKIFRARLFTAMDMPAAQPGTIVIAKAEQGLIVKTAEGLLNILELQMENHKKMSSRDFINGYRNLEGKLLISSASK